MSKFLLTKIKTTLWVLIFFLFWKETTARNSHCPVCMSQWDVMAVVTTNILEITSLPLPQHFPSAFLWAIVPWAKITGVYATVNLQCQWFFKFGQTNRNGEFRHNISHMAQRILLPLPHQPWGHTPCLSWRMERGILLKNAFFPVLVKCLV